MAFWSATTKTEPRRNFKFLLRVIDLPVWVVKGVNLPEINVGESEHKFLNHTFYFPGTVTFNEISFTVVDAIDNNISQRIIKNFTNSGYNTPGNEADAGESLITKTNSVRALGDVTIEHLGADEDGQEGKIAFKLRNAWVKQLQFPQGLAYDSEDLSEISVTLRYDFFDFLGDGEAAIQGFGA